MTVADVVRFTVPWTAALALAGRPDSLPALPGAAALPDAAAVRAWFAELAPDRVAYAAVTDPAIAAELAPDHRMVVSERGVCDVFALRPRVAVRDEPAQDGLPVPPPEMVQLVAGLSNPHRFYQRFIEGGTRTAERIAEMLQRGATAIESKRAVLDFGCGCGRVMRRWKDVEGPRLHGTDYNPYLVDWCRDHLPFAGFSVNGLEPGLAFDDAEFDLVYAYSVFTHLPEEMQAAWMSELVRVTAPGGHLWLTFHGTHAAADLGAPERARFEAGELVVVTPRGAGDYGTNACAVYHPPSYVGDTLAPSLEVIDFVPGDKNFIQDAYLLNKSG